LAKDEHAGTRTANRQIMEDFGLEARPKVSSLMPVFLRRLGAEVDIASHDLAVASFKLSRLGKQP
jgi:hypothetical protein